MPGGRLSAAEIYTQVHGGPGPQSLSAAQQAARELDARLQDRAAQVAQLGLAVQEGWKGKAGENAANAAGPLAEASQSDADRVKVASQAINDQLSAFDTVRNSVVPVSEKPDMTPDSFLTGMVGGGFGEYAAQLGKWQADSQANVEAFSAYHQASTGNGQTMPSSFAPLANPGAPITMAGGDTGGEPGVVRPGSEPGDVRSGPGGGDRPTPPITDYAQRPPAPPPGPPGTDAPPPGRSPSPDHDGTRAASFNPPPTPGPSQPGDYRFGPTGQPVSNVNTNPGPYGGNTGFGPTGGGPGTSGGYRGGGTGSGPGYRAGSGVPGAGRPGVPGQGPGGAGRATGAVPPNQPGAAPRGGAPGAGTGGRPGMGGMPMGAGAGAGRGKGGEDEERKSPDYLKNPDPDDTFGGYEGKATPPVIGEQRKDKR